MKHVYSLMAMLVLCIPLFAQTLTLNDLLSLAGISSGKFQHYASKRGFKVDKQQQDYVHMQYTRDTNNTLFLSRQWSNTGGWLRLEKITAADYEALKKKIKEDGFTAGTLKAKVRTEIFEKGPLLITASPEIDLEEGKRLYNIVIEHKTLPKAKDLRFAEDLLQLDSHQQLVQVFGEGNVKKDEFLQADGTSLACTIIYPQSPLEAVFIWKDGANYRSLQQVRVGGNPHTKSALRYNGAIPQNRWVSRQGVYPTMTLEQLCSQNGAPIQLYGWGEQYSGQLHPGTTGKLDFSQLNFVFSCFNCNEEKYYGDIRHNAADVIKDYRKVHVTTLILKPTQQEELTAMDKRK